MISAKVSPRSGPTVSLISSAPPARRLLIRPSISANGGHSVSFQSHTVKKYLIALSEPQLPSRRGVDIERYALLLGPCPRLRDGRIDPAVFPQSRCRLHRPSPRRP